MPFRARSLLALVVQVARAVGEASAPARSSPHSPVGRRHTGPTTTRPTVGGREHPAAPRTTTAGGALFDYSPSPDGRPDPGEIVWTWVPYEDDPRQGKDRPVLLVGREGPHLLGLMLTSRDRNNASEHDDRYVDIGTGPWDARGRPSEVKVDRLLRVDPSEVRREGAVLSRRRFEEVVARIPDRLLA